MGSDGQDEYERAFLEVSVDWLGTLMRNVVKISMDMVISPFSAV